MKFNFPPPGGAPHCLNAPVKEGMSARGAKSTRGLALERGQRGFIQKARAKKGWASTQFSIPKSTRARKIDPQKRNSTRENMTFNVFKILALLPLMSAMPAPENSPFPTIPQISTVLGLVVVGVLCMVKSVTCCITPKSPPKQRLNSLQSSLDDHILIGSIIKQEKNITESAARLIPDASFIYSPSVEYVV